MALLRSLTSLTLILCLLVTSGAMAVARGNTEIGSLVVICHGTGYATIEVGADGQPIDRTVICPDCTLTLLPDVAVPQPVAAILVLAQDVVPTAYRVWHGTAGPDRAMARGPPVRV